ncbi:MBL fold metallo-hydrolase [Leptolyngbya sp. FACHB-261]|nr:MBL fold metallo-hydrolase [Leptolyngbya sp. FACHB-261]
MNFSKPFKQVIVLILVACAVIASSIGVTLSSTEAQTSGLSTTNSTPHSATNSAINSTNNSATGSTTNAAVYRFKVGAIDALVVSDGSLTTPPLPNYAPTAEPAEVEQALRERFLPADQLTLYFNALYLDTGRNKILIDTGSGRELGPTLGRLAANLRAAGVPPETIDTVILTHAHPDHIGGILTAYGRLAYPNARYYISKAEWAFWTAANVSLASLKISEGFKQAMVAAAHRHLSAIRERVTLFQPGQEIVPGIQAVDAAGHTPGQTALLISSGQSRLIHAADVFFNEAFDLEHPDWQTGFDLDPAQAAATRRQLLNQVALNPMLVLAYHMPFPALGHIRARGERYEWEPTLWQFEVAD